MPRSKTLYVVIGLCCAVSRADAETISFHFAPPDDTAYIQTLVTEREREIEGMAKQVDRIETRTAYAIKRDGSDYIIAATPMSSQTTRDGQVVSDPIQNLFQGSPITFVVAADGKLKEVRGYDALTEKMQKSLPPEIAKALAPELNERMMVARETAEYNGRIGNFAGKDYTVGETIDEASTYQLPGGESLKYSLHTTVKGLEPCPPGKCARVEVTYDSDADAVGKAVLDTVNEVAKVVPGGNDKAPASIGGTKVAGTGSRLIDPKTMLIYAESLSRNIRMRLEVPGKGKVPSQLSETRTYTFEYQPSGNPAH